MEIWKRSGVRGLACTTTLVIWMGTPVPAQTAISEALPDAPDAALMLTSADSREATTGVPRIIDSRTGRPKPS